MNKELEKLLLFIGFTFLGEFRKDNNIKDNLVFIYLYHKNHISFMVYYYIQPSGYHIIKLNDDAYYYNNEKINLLIETLKDIFKDVIRKNKVTNLLN